MSPELILQAKLALMTTIISKWDSFSGSDIPGVLATFNALWDKIKS